MHTPALGAAVLRILIWHQHPSPAPAGAAPFPKLPCRALPSTLVFYTLREVQHLPPNQAAAVPSLNPCALWNAPPSTEQPDLTTVNTIIPTGWISPTAPLKYLWCSIWLPLKRARYWIWVIVTLLKLHAVGTDLCDGKGWLLLVSI